MSEQSRKSFEAWISAPPYERHVTRHPGVESSWPGQYHEYAVELAWQAWCEAANPISPEDALELRLLVVTLKREIEAEKAPIPDGRIARIGSRERELRRGVEALEKLLK